MAKARGITVANGIAEIISDNKFFDYEAKYSKGFSKHILPANIPEHIYKQCLVIRN